MRDFFWFAVLSVFMASVGDYYTTMKTVTIAKRNFKIEELDTVAAENSTPLILANQSWK